MKKYDVFISYSRNDLDIVETFVKDIEKNVGVRCWIDWTGIESGEEFEEVIVNAINSVDVVLFFLSEHSLKSHYAKLEVNYANNIGKKIVPIVVDGGALRGWFLFKFGVVDYIDINNARQVDKLKENLAVFCNVTPCETGKSYKVGDIYEDGKKKGVVFEVDPDGQHGKIVHPDEGWAQWARKTRAPQFSLFPDDGAVNLEAAKLQKDWAETYPAFNWCAQLGEGWYLPALNELKVLIDAADKINNTLKGCGGTVMDITSPLYTCWSSTQKSGAKVWASNSYINGWCSPFDLDFPGKVRAIAKF